MHPGSMNAMRIFAETLPKDKPLRIADIGSYDLNGTYRSLFANPAWSYTGYDIVEGPNVDKVCQTDQDWLLEGRGQYDVVISGQVLEHVEMPWVWIHTIASLIREGGECCIIAPNVWMFHEFPKDCWRVWPDGLRALFKWGGLDCYNAYFERDDTIGWAYKPVKNPLFIHACCGEEILAGFVRVDCRKMQATDHAADLDLGRHCVSCLYSNDLFQQLHGEQRVSHLVSTKNSLTKDGFVCYIGIPRSPDEQKIVKTLEAAWFSSSIVFTYCSPGEGGRSNCGFVAHNRVVSSNVRRSHVLQFLSRFPNKVNVDSVEFISESQIVIK
jgi:hypothetical protein